MAAEGCVTTRRHQDFSRDLKRRLLADRSLRNPDHPERAIPDAVDSLSKKLQT
jgi:hypothetical protein